MSFLVTMLEGCSNLLGAYLAQRLFEERFSRLVVRSAVQADWADGDLAIKRAVVGGVAPFAVLSPK
jgi:hypothetical protein